MASGAAAVLARSFRRLIHRTHSIPKVNTRYLSFLSVEFVRIFGSRLSSNSFRGGGKANYLCPLLFPVIVYLGLLYMDNLFLFLLNRVQDNCDV